VADRWSSPSSRVTEMTATLVAADEPPERGRKLVYSFTDPDLVSELDLLTDPDFGKLDPDGDY
jgi:hypothetical protein